MDAIEALLTRHSAVQLTDPAPSGTELQNILAAASNVPDHGKLKPWRFKIMTGDERLILGNLLAESLRGRLVDVPSAQRDSECAKEKTKALRAPMIIAIAAHLTPIAKIPDIEQIIAAGCAAHAMLLAAHALGFGGQWKTGPAARDENVKRGLGFDATDEIVGFIYLGSIAGIA